MSALKAIFGFLWALLKLILFRGSLNNSPEMRKAKEAQEQVDETSKAEIIVARKDTNETRDALAE